MNCEVQDLGLIDYQQAYAYQMAMVRQRFEGKSDVLLLCEHPAVLTMGRMFKPENLFFSEDDLRERGVALTSIDRGGDITLHAPGQLVVYPIVQLQDDRKDLRWYLRQLEKVVINVLADFNIDAAGSDDQRGVWVGRDKIASMGIGVKKWVCYHGVGLNVSTDLSLFSLIRPCGLDVQMTSLEKLTGGVVEMDCIKKIFVKHFQKVFECTMKEGKYDNNLCA